MKIFRAVSLIALMITSATGFAADPGNWVSGITEAINDVTLSAPAAGTVAARRFQEGQFVKAGDTIVELDNQLEQLEVNRRKLMRDLKKSEMDSSKKIFEKTISLSREEMEKKVAEYSIAEAEFQLAQEQLRRRFVIAPFEGEVSALLLRAGEACQAQQPLVRLVDTRKCFFICNIEARSAAGLKPGETVKLQIEAGRGTAEFDGTIFFVSPVVDPASGLMRVKVVFENPNGRIRPGVAGRMLLTEKKDV